MGVSKTWKSYSIKEQVVGAETDRYLDARCVCASRKFLPAYFPISAWTEVWFGVRMRFVLDYYWPTGTNYVEGDAATLIGLCNMSQPGVFGGGPNAVDAWSAKHAIGIRFQAVGTTVWTSNISAGGKYYIGGSAVPMKIENNIATAGTGLSCNYPADPTGRSLVIFRMLNSAGTVTINMLSGTGDVLGQDIPSNILADAISQPTWNAVKAFLPTFTERSPVGTITVDEAVNGALNGFFFTCPRHYDGFQISDVVVRGL